MTVYRAAATSCPHCSAFMEEQDMHGVVIEVCSQCSGLWIDWFDGDLATVAAKARQIRPGAPTREPGTGVCPKCHVPLTESRYRGDGPSVLRCGECAGAFVPRDMVDVLVALGPPVEQLERPVDPWAQLIEHLRAWIEHHAHHGTR